MNIQLDPRVLIWFKDEMNVSSGHYIRFFVRYGGSSPLHQGFSLGVSKDEPIEIGTKIEADGAVYFIEQSDLWYFDNHDLYVKYNEKLDEPEYEYIKQS
ncbi:HesB/YadR/YfhF family protein [Bacillus sp. B190/17]|uniref:HesB/YadR/YfhF family protein n=1 Tax=Bacillus lumedeiriae TaxID=3058829 RepID=A0ABW8I6R1_9BACI